MTIYDEMANDFARFAESNGISFTITTYPSNAIVFSGTNYDEAYYIAASGTTISGAGFFQPLSNKYGSTDAMFFEQGKVNYNDMKLFVAGSITTNSNMFVKVANAGSYSVIPDGIQAHPSVGSPVYKSIYLRLHNDRDDII